MFLFQNEMRRNDGIHSQSCIALQLIYWCTENMEKIQSIQTQSKEHVHPFKYNSIPKMLWEPSQSIQLQINNHSHSKNWESEGVRGNFFSCQTSSTICQDQVIFKYLQKPVNDKSGIKNRASVPQQQFSQNPLNLKFNFYK